MNQRSIIILSLIFVTGVASYSYSKLRFKFSVKEVVAELNSEQENKKNIDNYSQELSDRQERRISLLSDSLKALLEYKMALSTSLNLKGDTIQLLRDSLANAESTIMYYEAGGKAEIKKEFDQKFENRIIIQKEESEKSYLLNRKHHNLKIS